MSQHVWSAWLAFILVAVVSFDAVAARRKDAEQLMREAAVRYREAQFEEALELILQAEQLAKSELALGRLLRMKGAAFAVLKRYFEAVVAFKRALELQQDLELDPREHSELELDLFRCAQVLAAGDIDPDDMRAELEEGFERHVYRCGVGDASARSVALLPSLGARTITSTDAEAWALLRHRSLEAFAALESPPSAPTYATLEPPPEPDSAWSLGVFIAVSVAAIGGAIAIGFAVAGGPEVYGGSTGVIQGRP